MSLPSLSFSSFAGWLAGRTCASAAEVAAAMALPPAQAGTFLVVLETLHLVSSRQDPDSRAPRRVFTVTAEGRRRAGIGDRETADA